MNVKRLAISYRVSNNQISNRRRNIIFNILFLYIVSSSHLNDGNNIRTKMFHIGDVMLLSCVEKQWLCFFLILFLVKLPMQIELSTAFRLVWVFHISFAIRTSPLHTSPFHYVSRRFTPYSKLVNTLWYFYKSW